MSARFNHAEMAEEMSKLIYSKRMWLDAFSAKRPPHEVETRQRELAALEQAEADYRRAAERRAAA